VTDVVVRRANVNVAPDDGGDTTLQFGAVSCEAGEVAVGGGAGITGVLGGAVNVTNSEPLEADGTPPENGDVATGWRALGVNVDDEDAATMHVHVLCARP
jgi:hypothetical protein